MVTYCSSYPYWLGFYNVFIFIPSSPYTVPSLATQWTFLGLVSAEAIQVDTALTLRSRWSLVFFVAVEVPIKMGWNWIHTRIHHLIAIWWKIECFPSRDGSTQPPSSTILNFDGNSDGKCVIVVGFFWKFMGNVWDIYGKYSYNPMKYCS